jgi:L-ascorbate peroxidase
MSSAARFAGPSPLDAPLARRAHRSASSKTRRPSPRATSSWRVASTADSASGSGRATEPTRVERGVAVEGLDAASAAAPARFARRELFALAAAALASPAAMVPAGAATAAATAVDTPEARAALREALVANVVKTKAPAVLRLVFHDAGTRRVATNDGGANASVRFELGRPESFGLKRGLGPVTAVYEATRDGPASGLSFADVIAASGAYAVELTGGPEITSRLRFGRKDASSADPENRMPGESASGEETRAAFAAMGYTLTETVCLAGAHTIGGKGFGEPYVFDNEYYKTLLVRPWDGAKNPGATKDDLEMGSHVGLTSDKNLAIDKPSLEVIERYARDQDLFFEDFAKVYVKMTESGATWRDA